MCRDCGCGLPGEQPGISKVHSHGHEHDHEHEHEHEHAHENEHAHEHEHEGGVTHAHPHAHSHTHGSAERRVVEVRQAILDKNDRQAERNRGFFRARGLLTLNVLSSPGSGKTTFIRETINLMKGQLKAGVIVGDLATDNDGRRLQATGAPVVQITTGTMCHLESEMVARSLRDLDLNGLELLIIENVGNLVCPASYDLGEDFRVVLLSVTEGEDKPLKYPPMFQSAQVVIVSKIDLAEPCGYDGKTAMANIRRVSPKAEIFELSAKTGKGMDAWREFLLNEQKKRQGADLLS